MAIPTPEQIRIYRHRRKVWMAVQVGCVTLGPIAGIALLRVASKHIEIPGVLMFGVFVSVVIGMFLFQHFYYRCPVCDRALGRGAKHIKAREFFKGHCKKCGADYAA